MVHKDWRSAVAEIGKITGDASDQQHEIAAVAKITLSSRLPYLVAAARIQSALGSEIGATEATEVQAWQEEILQQLSKGPTPNSSKPRDRREADALIKHLRLKKRSQSIKSLKLNSGDIVQFDGNVAEISSIGDDGRVYFKGGAGAGAWPDLLTVACRRDDKSKRALNLKKLAANEIALKARTDSWSLNKQRELEDFKVTSQLTHENVEMLQEVIRSAPDEKPIQRYIEANPVVLAAVLTGRSRFLIPRPPLGGKFVPDFLISDLDSLGIRWILVELETPISSVTLRQNDLAKVARRGISQIEEWRSWLENNLDFARRSKRADGLGLVDIRPRSEGLLLVGRRTLLNQDTTAVRHRFFETNRIRVHTYDWLVEALQATLQYAGPPVLNPYALAPPSDEDSYKG
ncbi:MAG: Shedu anti-phage system protein SduA domain-containing protein [Methyloligella sp. ZOD6]